MFRGKKYKDSAKQIDRGTLYDPKEGLELVCKTASAKFDETVELHVKLGVDSRHADQQVRGAIVLPNGTGKTARVLVFAKGDKADAAREAGADFVGDMDMVEKIQKENWFDFDVVVASPDMMGVVGRLGKLLGPKGLMPSPKAGTVTPDVAKAVKEVKAGKVEYRLDKTNIIHCPIGKVSFGADKLYENYSALIGAIIKAKPAAAKGQYIKSCHGPRREDERQQADLTLHRVDSTRNASISSVGCLTKRPAAGIIFDAFQRQQVAQAVSPAEDGKSILIAYTVLVSLDTGTVSFI